MINNTRIKAVYSSFFTFFLFIGLFGAASSKLGAQLRGAAQRGDLETIQQLCTYYDVYIDDRDPVAQWTALHDACRKGNVGVVIFLCEHGADVMARNKDGITPLHRAAEFSRADLIDILCEHGAEVNDGAEESLLTPLHSALRPDYRAEQEKQLETVKKLLERGADPSLRQTDACVSPFHIALNTCSNCTLQILDLMLAYGASVSDVGVDGKCALHYVAGFKYGRADVTEFLLEHGADPHTLDALGLNPLHRACIQGSNEVAQLLCEVEGLADTVVEDEFEIRSVGPFGMSGLNTYPAGQTPLTLARLNLVTLKVICVHADLRRLPCEMINQYFHFFIERGVEEVAQRFAEVGARKVAEGEENDLLQSLRLVHTSRRLFSEENCFLFSKDN